MFMKTNDLTQIRHDVYENKRVSSRRYFAGSAFLVNDSSRGEDVTLALAIHPKSAPDPRHHGSRAIPTWLSERPRIRFRSSFDPNYRRLGREYDVSGNLSLR